MMVARSEGAVETENRDLRGIEGTEVVRSWDRRRGVQHDSRFSFGPSGYWWTGNVTGRRGTGMVIDSVGVVLSTRGLGPFQVDVQKPSDVIGGS